MNMKTLLSFLKSLLPTLPSPVERDEAYLAQAVDICDLERRVREIDERGRANLPPIARGLHAR